MDGRITKCTAESKEGKNAERGFVVERKLGGGVRFYIEVNATRAIPDIVDTESRNSELRRGFSDSVKGALTCCIDRPARYRFGQERSKVFLPVSQWCARGGRDEVCGAEILC